MSRLTTKQHGAAGIARRAHKMATLRSLDRNEVLLLFIFPFAKLHIWPHAVDAYATAKRSVYSISDMS